MTRHRHTLQLQYLGNVVYYSCIEYDKDYTVATIDYLADGNDGLTPLANADKRECPDGMTLRGLFLDYVRQQTAAGKKITSKLDGRITVVPASDQK